VAYSLEELRIIANGPPIYDWLYVRDLLQWAVAQLDEPNRQAAAEQSEASEC
jgi:hypothetical protein